MRISDWSSDVCSSDLSYLQGLPVLGRIEDVDKIAPEVAAKLIVIAMPSIDAAAMRRVVEACERTGLPFRTVPRLDDLLEGRSLPRSEEHTPELQSLMRISYAVFCLQKKNRYKYQHIVTQ